MEEEGIWRRGEGRGTRDEGRGTREVEVKKRTISVETLKGYRLLGSRNWSPGMAQTALQGFEIELPE